MTDADLKRLFDADGFVVDARVMTYPESGRPTGSVIVDMGSESEGAAAIAALDGRDYRGRPLVVGRAAGSSADSERAIEAMISEGGPVLALAFEG